MKIAVIGSREGFTKEQIGKVMVVEFGQQGHTLVTGGARGVDTFAIEFAKENNYPSTEVIKPLNPSNKLDYLFRNIEIITKADKILAFWDGMSRGTKFVIDYARGRKKDITVYNSRGDKIE